MANINEATGELAKKLAKFTSTLGGKGALVLGGTIAAGTAADIGVKIHNKALQREQEREQERSFRKKKEEEFDVNMYYELDRLSGLPQQLFNNRTGHSNSWGGKKY